MIPGDFADKLFNSDFDFEKAALELFHHQVNHVDVYRSFVSLLHTNISGIQSINDIPYLPVEFFKTQKIIAGGGNAEVIFSSSGTTGQSVSQHFVSSLNLYEQSFISSFRYFYGKETEYCFLCLLPSYLERKGSSLIYMCENLIRKSNHKLSGFYLDEFEQLYKVLHQLQSQHQKTILIGVTFALIDFAEFVETKGGFGFDELIIMETGGMKGRREELIRQQVHELLLKTFKIQSIHSEYGMTELLSQSYSKGFGKFFSPPWQKVLIRDINDAGTILATGKQGGVSIIDLANIYSCAFIATKDLGRTFEDGSFEVTGRFDSSDLRGCNLMLV